MTTADHTTPSRSTQEAAIVAAERRVWAKATASADALTARQPVWQPLAPLFAHD